MSPLLRASAASPGSRGRASLRPLVVAVAASLVIASCTQGGPASLTAPTPTAAESAAGSAAGSVPPSVSPTPALSGTIRLYTSVTQGTVDAVVAVYKAAHPAVTVEVFRAPTGELAGRIAAEQREGRIRGDILWLTDPLSIQAYASQGLLRTWQPAAAAALDPAYRGEAFWGTRLLNMVMIRGADVTPGPASWKDLADPAYRDAVAIPDPGFAGSAFGALGYFALTEGYGLDFYRSLKANGAVQVKSPDEVTTGVAEGRFKVGMTLDYSARTAIGKGSPIEIVWPDTGAIAIYSPIAVVGATDNAPAAESFVELVLSDAGQRAIASTGWQPVLPGAGGPQPGGPQVAPDWATAFGRQKELLADYRAIFGG